MGPHPAIMHVLAADHERLVHPELVRQALLDAEALAYPAKAATCPRQVALDVAGRAATPRWATLRLSRIVGLLVVLLIGVSVLVLDSSRAAAWEAGAGSGGPGHATASAKCMTGMELFTLLADGDGSAVQPAAPWCAAHC